MPRAVRSASWTGGAAAFYGLVLAYGTLYPLAGWELPHITDWTSLMPSWTARAGRIDLLTNLVIYCPFGALLAWAWRRPLGRTAAVLAAGATGGLLSLTLEVVQGFLPARVPSMPDLITNTIGSFAGAAGTGLLSPSLPFRRHLEGLRHRWIAHRGDTAHRFAVLALWQFSQLSPFVPSADLGNLRSGLRPFWSTLYDPLRFNLHHAASYVLAIGGLGLVAAAVFRRQQKLAVASVVFGTLLLKVPVITRQLSLEAVVGSTAGFAAFLAMRRQPSRARPLLVTLAILGHYVVEGLRPYQTDGPQFQAVPMNWVPFGNYRLNLFDFADILGAAWPFVALSWALRCATRDRRHQRAMVVQVGTAMTFAVALAVEWAQRWIPGRSPDVTDCVIATTAWLIAGLDWGRRRGRRHRSQPRHG